MIEWPQSQSLTSSSTSNRLILSVAEFNFSSSNWIRGSNGVLLSTDMMLRVLWVGGDLLRDALGEQFNHDWIAAAALSKVLMRTPLQAIA